MNSAAPREPVDEAVFDFLDTHLDEFDLSDDGDDPIKPPGVLGDFLVTFFQQYFDAAWKTEIKAIDQTSKKEVARLRLRNKDLPKPTRLLLTAFEELCDVWADFLGFHYAGHGGEIKKFNETFLTKLLRRIVAWAKEGSFARIEARANESLTRLEAADG